MNIQPQTYKIREHTGVMMKKVLGLNAHSNIRLSLEGFNSTLRLLDYISKSKPREIKS